MLLCNFFSHFLMEMIFSQPCLANFVFQLQFQFSNQAQRYVKKINAKWSFKILVLQEKIEMLQKLRKIVKLKIYELLKLMKCF